MPVINEPGFWDYLGQGLGNFGNSIREFQQQKEEKRRMKVQQISQMVSSGQMDPMIANQDPDIKAAGINFAPTPQSVSRQIAMSPQGRPDLSKYIAPTGPGSPVTIPAMKPWSDDMRRFAGQPTSAQLAAEDLINKKTALTSKYLADPGSLTQPQASVIGVKTPQELQVEQRKGMEPLITSAADRFVDEAIAKAGLSLSDPKALRRQAGTLAEAAYNSFLADAGTSGSMMGNTPEDKAYARTFFASAMQNYVKQAEGLSHELRKAQISAGGQSQSEAVRIYSALTATADDYQRQAKDLASSPMGMAAMATDPSKMTPQIKSIRDEIIAAQAAAAKHRKIAVQVLSGKISPSAVSQLMGEDIPVPTGQQGAATGGIPDMDPSQMQQAKSYIARVPDNQKADFVRGKKNLLSPKDYATLLSFVGAK